MTDTRPPASACPEHAERPAATISTGPTRTVEAHPTAQTTPNTHGSSPDRQTSDEPHQHQTRNGGSRLNARFEGPEIAGVSHETEGEVLWPRQLSAELPVGRLQLVDARRPTMGLTRARLRSQEVLHGVGRRVHGARSRPQAMETVTEPAAIMRRQPAAARAAARPAASRGAAATAPRAPRAAARGRAPRAPRAAPAAPPRAPRAARRRRRRPGPPR